MPPVKWWWLFPWRRLVWLMDDAEKAIAARVTKVHNAWFIRYGSPDAPPYSFVTARAAAIFAVALPLGLALIWELVTDVGDNFEQGFYTAMAALMPLLLIAHLVEAASSLRRLFEEHDVEDFDSEEDRDDVRIAVVDQILGRVVWSAGVSEFASLYALASGGSSAFLAALAVFPLLRIMPELLRAHRERFTGLRRSNPSP